MTTEGTSPIEVEERDGVAVISLDDGKANVLTTAVMTELDDLLARFGSVSGPVGAILLKGRDGILTGGIDLRVLEAGGAPAAEMRHCAGRLLLRVCKADLPVVVACTGHAVAAGAMLLLAADQRLGVAGDFKIGFNEVAAGMALPELAIELARPRLAPTHLARATLAAELFDPTAALSAGFLDAVVSAEEVAAESVAAARRLAAFDRAAYRDTKRALRQPVVDKLERILAGNA